MKAWTNSKDERYFMECDICGEERECKERSKNKYWCSECEHDAWLDHCEDVRKEQEEN